MIHNRSLKLAPIGKTESPQLKRSKTTFESGGSSECRLGRSLWPGGLDEGWQNDASGLLKNVGRVASQRRGRRIDLHKHRAVPERGAGQIGRRIYHGRSADREEDFASQARGEGRFE